MASLARLVNTLPVPLFGSVGTAAAFIGAKARMLPRMAGWAVPLGAGALWFIWPAVDDGWKIEVGIKADPEAAAKAAEAAKEAPVTKVAVEEKAVAALPAAALQEIEEAPKAHAHVAETNEDKLFVKAASSGDFTYLEEKWEEFAVRSWLPWYFRGYGPQFVP